jgi:tRNA pseudouridine38-40 synthase
MSRFRLDVEYDGTRYSGWQMQKGGKTIQGEILDACRELFESDQVEITGAGRTDAGVHALGQVAHMDAVTGLPPLRIKYGINDRLPHDICITDVTVQSPEFHARYDAKARSYIYQICRRRTAFGKKYVWWIKDPLDTERMAEAAGMFKGHRDFRSFTDPDHEQSSTKTEVYHSSVTDYGDLILFHVIGRNFLWKQVRRMAGVLAETGRGNMNPSQISSFFRSMSDIPAKLTAPPSGLILERVYYQDEKFSLQPSPLLRF